MSVLKFRDENGNITEVPALKGDKGDSGADGKTPVKGEDYFTEADKDEIVADTVTKINAKNPLFGKKIVYDGDSICESRTGSTANNGGGYAKIIADKVGGTYDNQAVSGANLSTTPEGESYHSVVDNLESLPKDGDLYCFEGGINDFWRGVELGSCDMTDYIGEVDTSTICGAMEAIFRFCLDNLIGRPICFIITHKVQSTAYSANGTGKTFDEYREGMIQVCEKYSIPYYDAFKESGLNGWNPVQSKHYLTANTDGTADGTHPNEEGYKRYYVPQLISLFEKMMPTDITNAELQEPSEEIINLIDTVGYTDGYRLSNSTGELRELEGYTTTGFIEVTEVDDVLRTSGVNFNGEIYTGNCVFAIYDENKNYVSSSYINTSVSHTPSYVDGICDDNGNATITVTGGATLPAYIRLSGYGSGADLIVTKNQEIG